MNFAFLNFCFPFLFQKTSEVMNAEVFSALTRNVGKLREMKKAHEEMAAELAQLQIEKEQAGSKFLELHSSKIFCFGFIAHSSSLSSNQQVLLLRRRGLLRRLGISRISVMRILLYSRRTSS